MAPAPGARLGLVHGIGGVLSSAATAILGGEPPGQQRRQQRVTLRLGGP